MSSRIPTCGTCPQFVLNEVPDPKDWDGKCEALGIGRHSDTRACSNKSLQSK